MEGSCDLKNNTLGNRVQERLLEVGMTPFGFFCKSTLALLPVLTSHGHTESHAHKGQAKAF